MFPSFSLYNRLSNYIVYEVYICCLYLECHNNQK